MPRYLIERTFPNGPDVPASDAGASLRRAVTDTVFGVTWDSFLRGDGWQARLLHLRRSLADASPRAECEQHSVTHVA